MAAGITISVNVASIKRALGSKSGEINKAIEKTAEVAAKAMVRRAKANVSLKSGKLKKSIGASVSKAGRFTKIQFTIKSVPGRKNPGKDPIYYWSLVEYGGVTRGRNGHRMAIPVGDEDQYPARQAIDNPALLGFKRMFSPSGSNVILGDRGRGGTAEVAYILIDKVKNTKRPFMKPAMQETIPELKRSIKAVITKILSGSSAGSVASEFPRNRSSI